MSLVCQRQAVYSVAVDCCDNVCLLVPGILFPCRDARGDLLVSCSREESRVRRRLLCGMRHHRFACGVCSVCVSFRGGKSGVFDPLHRLLSHIMCTLTNRVATRSGVKQVPTIKTV